MPAILVASTASAQTPATFSDNLGKIPRGSFRFMDLGAMENWAFDVFTRLDGWVEIDLAIIPRKQRALPWLYKDGRGGKLGPPVLTRAYFTPAQIRAATRFADSLLDGAIPPAAIAKRLSTRAPDFLAMPRGMGERYESYLFSMSVFVMRSRRPEIPDSAGFNLGGCLNVEGANPALMGRAVRRSAQEFRAILRSLDTAADRAEMYAPTPKPMHADVVNADQASCMAQPQPSSIRAAYPAGGGSRTADVHVDAVVDTSGRIDASSIKVIMGGEPVFDTAAVSAIQRWHFAPAVLTTSVPVAQRVHIHVHFARTSPTNAELDRIVDEASSHGAEVIVVSTPRAN